jgi:uncharacterized protein
MGLPLQGQPAKVKLLALLLIALGSIFISFFVTFLLIEPIFGIPFTEAASMVASPKSQLEINALKFVQLINALFLFIIPPFVLVAFITNKKWKFFNLDKAGPVMIYFIIPAIMVAAVPLINYMAEINKAMQLPEGLGWLEQRMKEMEANAERITKLFLEVETTTGLLYNLLLIAIIPAVGEELLFRGTLQKLLYQGTASKHLAIWVAAILFSALHLQFYGFLPRTLMGALFGYLLVWSGSLWAPIFAHFINNGFAVVVSFLVHKKELSPEVEHLGEGEGQGLQVAVSAIIVISLLIFYCYTCRQNKRNNPPEDVEGFRV